MSYDSVGLNPPSSGLPFAMPLPSPLYATVRNISDQTVDIGYAVAFDVADKDGVYTTSADYAGTSADNDGGPLARVVRGNSAWSKTGLYGVVVDLLQNGGANDSLVVVQYQGLVEAYVGSQLGSGWPIFEAGLPLVHPNAAFYFEYQTTPTSGRHTAARYWDLDFTPAAQATTNIINATLKQVVLLPWGDRIL